MQCVILAAGRGTRMGDLTNEVPKPMLKVNGKTLLEYKLEQLPPEIDEVIFVVGYLGDKIKEYFGDSWNGKSVKYVVQPELNGTGGAIHCAKELLRGKFVVMMGDDLYVLPDIENCIKKDWAILVQRSLSTMKAGRIEVDSRGCLKGITEGADLMPGDLVNTAMYVLGMEFFDYPLVQIPGKTEFGLPQTLVSMADKHAIELIEAIYWHQMTTPQDLIMAQQFIKN